LSSWAPLANHLQIRRDAVDCTRSIRATLEAFSDRTTQGSGARFASHRLSGDGTFRAYAPLRSKRHTDGTKNAQAFDAFPAPDAVQCCCTIDALTDGAPGALAMPCPQRPVAICMLAARVRVRHRRTIDNKMRGRPRCPPCERPVASGAALETTAGSERRYHVRKVGHLWRARVMACRSPSGQHREVTKCQRLLSHNLCPKRRQLRESLIRRDRKSQGRQARPGTRNECHEHSNRRACPG
jgi:hypothetical protein